MSQPNDDIGLRAIADLVRLLQIGAEWGTPTDRGFSWSGLSLEQNINQPDFFRALSRHDGGSVDDGLMGDRAPNRASPETVSALRSHGSR